MPAEWLKIELALPDKPEVHFIANGLNIDPDLVVGKLVKVWAWFDKHTSDGYAHGVTLALLDRITGVTSFGEMMQFAGWMMQSDAGLQMPKFDAHTSQSSKKRALTAKRVAKLRNADVTLDALARKEKKRSKPTDVDAGASTVRINGSFSNFWALYPKRVCKSVAEKAWLKINPDPDLTSKILDSVQKARSCPDWNRDEGKYIPHPATWLNQHRWEDELDAKQERFPI